MVRVQGAFGGGANRTIQPDDPLAVAARPLLHRLVRRVRVLLAEFRKFERELSSIPRYANLKQQRVPLSNCIV